MQHAIKYDEYRDAQSPLKTDLDCAVDEIEEALGHLENGILLLQNYTTGPRVVGEHLWRMKDYADAIKNARHEIECALIDIHNEA